MARAEVFTLYDGTAQAVTPTTYEPTRLSYGSYKIDGFNVVTGPQDSYDAARQATYVNTAGASSDNDFYVGYSNYSIFGVPVTDDFPTLDRQLGYSVSFSLEILSETHEADDRAGFSVLAVSSDVSDSVNTSIEIGFQANRIFAQNDNFNGFAVESTEFNPVGVGFVDYELSVLGDSFDLSANGASVLSGALHDHVGEVDPPLGLSSPYEISNFIFLGDNTTSASAEFHLRRASVTTVPEPSSLALLMVGGAVALVLSARRYRARAAR